MRKNIGLLCLTGLLLTMYGCKKDGSNNSTSTGSTAIVGKWLVTKERTRVYSTSGTLLKDSTDTFANDLIDDAWLETYNKDGSGAVIYRADTSSTYTYTVSGSTLTSYPYGDHTDPEADKILSLNGTTMELELYYTGTPSSVWRLDPNGIYKFVWDDYYAKQ